MMILNTRNEQKEWCLVLRTLNNNGLLLALDLLKRLGCPLYVGLDSLEQHINSYDCTDALLFSRRNLTSTSSSKVLCSLDILEY